ncbi:DnaD domain protein [Lactococcus lactis]|uniref:DnaD domain protein n=1 Tax=Lactococcus lactis TaxID=1358 RepID=UPI0019113857|nr:DnaD domain protein [Lactococcus lactis]WDA67643.1 DnaD domain protein [Lactococcus lactis]
MNPEQKLFWIQDFKKLIERGHMNLIEAFNAFDSWTRLNTLSANQRSLYIAILQLWNAAGRPEYSSIPEQKLTELSGLSKKTFYNVRNQLEEFGLITVLKSKSKNIAPKYTLKDISVKNDDNFTPISTPNVTPILTPKVTPNLAPYTEKSREEKSREESSSDKSELVKLKDFYVQNFGMMSPLTYDDLQHSLTDYGFDLSMEAMIRAVRQQKSFSTALSILKYWSNNGIKTLEDAMAERASFERKKTGYSAQKNQSNKTSKDLPKWSDGYKLSQAGVDITGLSQNEMYKLAEEMGLHNDDK